MSTFDDIKLNDGRSIPGIGFGTWKIGSGQTVVDQVDQAVEVGFTHIDTAQIYRNEPETGDALAASGTSRDRFWITSKYAAIDPTLGIYDACKESVKRLKIDSLDLYLIHHPMFTNGDIPGAWAEMERVKKDGLAKSIGVSNFSIADLQMLLKHAKIKPAVNQIVLHPYVWKKQAPLMAFQEEHGIVTEGYSPLAPLTTLPDGPVNKPIQRIAKRLQVAPEQVLIAWAKAKGAVVLTWVPATYPWSEVRH
ncbi:Aldo/keto reductase [Clavulina sp. PMI_390]|nr:Aldo/keto reductase [Clavulina sp. PMI_390]